VSILRPKRTNKFHELYEHLARTQPIAYKVDDEVPKFEQLNQDKEQTVYSLCVTLAGIEVADHVHAFLDAASLKFETLFT
jgi:hypothetical protein